MLNRRPTQEGIYSRKGKEETRMERKEEKEGKRKEEKNTHTQEQLCR